MRKRPVVNEDIAINDPALAQQYSAANAQIIAKEKQEQALKQQINKLEMEKIELEKAKGAIEQKAGQNNAQQQKDAQEQQKIAAVKAASDAAAGKTAVAPATVQNASAVSILKRTDNDLSEDDSEIRYSPGMGSTSMTGRGNWYDRPVTGGHKEKTRAPRPKLMDFKRKMKIQDMENEILDLKSDQESIMANYKAPDFEGVEGEIEQFFASVGDKASDILNSGGFKNDKEKIEALKAAGVKDPEDILRDYYYYYPEFDPSKEKGRKKAEKEAEKIQTKIDRIREKIDKWENVYEGLNEYDESEPYNPASAENFYNLSEDYVEVEGKKKLLKDI